MHRHRPVLFCVYLLSLTMGIAKVHAWDDTAPLQGIVLDQDTGQPVAARLYVRSLDDPLKFHTVGPADGGHAVAYQRVRETRSEVHTTITREGFHVDLPPGRYEIVAERGKEYFTGRQEIELGPDGKTVELRLRRWINMAQLGWFSGDTHVHRGVDELPTAMLADDLNVALPLTYWVTDTRHTPLDNPRNDAEPPAATLIRIDDTHVIWPVNTEYELFTVDGKRHTLGAFFVLNHKRPLALAAPPVGPVVESARREPGVLLDLDKHNWPWSMMLIPIADIDLFELTNNHLWRTDFLFREWYPEYARGVLEVERDDEGGFTEKGWLDFGLQNYYLLLNCGFAMRPTAGTASGVHPVPLGFGRVYVQLEEEFSYDGWIAGLDKGNSFVTTGPLMDIRFNDELPGSRLKSSNSQELTVNIQGWVESPDPISAVEVVVDGVARRLDGQVKQTESGTYRIELDSPIQMDRSGWMAVRCFAHPTEDRWRFAHTGPVHIDIPDRPARPRVEEVDYLIGRITEELERHQGTLPEAALDEYRRAQAAFESLLDR